MRYRATSYSMGNAIKSIEFDAVSNSAAVNHPDIRKLPRGVIERGSKIRVVGVKRLG